MIVILIFLAIILCVLFGRYLGLEHALLSLLYYIAGFLTAPLLILGPDKFVTAMVIMMALTILISYIMKDKKLIITCGISYYISLAFTMGAIISGIAGLII